MIKLDGLFGCCLGCHTCIILVLPLLSQANTTLDNPLGQFSELLWMWFNQLIVLQFRLVGPVITCTGMLNRHIMEIWYNSTRFTVIPISDIEFYSPMQLYDCESIFARFPIIPASLLNNIFKFPKGLIYSNSLMMHWALKQIVGAIYKKVNNISHLSLQAYCIWVCYIKGESMLQAREHSVYP